MSDAPDEFIFPLTYSQAQLWYIYQLEPTAAVYNIPFAFRVRGPLDIDRLERAAQKLVDKHESLRTNYRIIDSEPSQVVAAKREIAVTVTDLTANPEQMPLVLEEILTRPFVLETELLFRVHVIQIANDDAVLTLSWHHITIDHWSVLILGHELEAAYASGATDDTFETRADTLQYPDFAVWQREALTPEVINEKLTFWKDTLGNAEQILQLPADRTRPAFISFAGKELSLRLSDELSQRVRAYARERNQSLFVVGLAAFDVLLHRLTGQASITVGCPFANRSEEALEEVIGLFMNLLPLPVHIAPETTFADLSEQVRKRMASCQAHQDTPFELIVNACLKERDPSRNPLLQAVFMFQDPPMGLTLQGLQTEYMPVHNQGAKVDLSLWLWDAGAHIEGVFEYNTDLFEQASMESLLERFVAALDELIEHHDRPVSRVSITLPSDLAQFSVWNATERAMSGPATLPASLFARERDWQAPAVVCDDSVLSHEELRQQSIQIANVLHDAGVRAGDLVGVLMERRLDLLPTLLGIMQLGAGYSPLDPQYPRDRILYILRDANVKVVCAHGDVRSLIAGEDVPVIEIDSRWQEIASAPTDPSWDTVTDPESVLYVIHTSGSTGNPKGVKVPHRAVANFLETMAKTPGLGASDRLLAVTTLSFDIAVLELYLPIMVGGRVILASRDTARDATLLADLSSTSGATVMQATPTTWRMLLAAGWVGGADFKALCGGEALPRDLADALIPVTGELWNMYGPTETTVWSTCTRLRTPGEPILVGTPIANTQCHVLDDAGQPCPIGIPGELFIGGTGVTLGYLNRDDLTTERFVDDPFISDPDATMYATGDLVRWTSDGLEHRGRMDTQVKLRGFRIELEEIEATITRIDKAVMQCVASVWSPNANDHRLVVYLQHQPGQQIQVAQLRKALRLHLPEYMVPQHFVPIDSIPQTNNGKVDRKRLPEPSIAGARERTIVPPSTDAESFLVDLWQGLLDRKGVSVDDNFFDIGGHSLLATEMIMRIDDHYGVRVPARSIVIQSLTEMARLLDVTSVTEMPADGATTPPDKPRAGLLARLFRSAQ